METLSVKSPETRGSASVTELERAYLKRADWEVRENANTNMSYSNFLGFMMDKFLKNPQVLSHYLPREAVRMHFRGDIHIHKLPHSLWIPYCAGWSYGKILRVGLRTPTIQSRPARHLDTAVSHLINYFFLAAQEWTGAQAVSAFDLYVAPFVRSDGLSYGQVKQVVQRMLFELNYPIRALQGALFTNVTLVLDLSKRYLEGEAVVGGRAVGELGDYVGEAELVARALLELYLEGDAWGQPFTFPIATLLVTRDFDWSGRRWGDLTDLIFETLASRGTAYLLNGYAANVESLYSMCCRLTIDVSKVINNNFKLALSDADELEEFLRKNRGAFGIWALPDATGSIGVVTVNMPRLAALSGGDWGRLEELLRERLEVARSVLGCFRRRYEVSMRAGLMPVTKVYLGHLTNHFSTIGLVGLPEAAANFMLEPDVWSEGSVRDLREAVSLERRMVALVRELAAEFEEEDGCLYNVEEVPAESAAYRLARLDCELFGEEVERGEVLVPSDGAPFYSNSIVPYYADVPLPLRAELEGEVQQEFTGGVMMHVFLYERPDPEALKRLVYRIATQTRVVYFSITPAMTACRSCHRTTVGIYAKCPVCGSERVEVWSRIVGYYRPLSNWNVGKRAEFRTRVHYGNSGALTPKLLGAA